MGAVGQHAVGAAAALVRAEEVEREEVDVKMFCRGAKSVAGLGTAQIFLKNTAAEQVLSVEAGGAGGFQRR